MLQNITISSKGQIVIPSNIREQLQWSTGDSLQVEYDAKSQTIVLKKALTIEQLTAIASSFIKPGTKPVLNADEFYQKYRKPPNSTKRHHCGLSIKS